MHHNVPTFDPTRRRMILNGAASTAFLLVQARMGFAQTNGVAGVSNEFLGAASGLRDRLVETPPMPDMTRSQLGGLVFEHYDQRVRLHAELARFTPEEQRTFALASYPTEVRLLEESLGPILLPPERAIVPVEPVVLPPPPAPEETTPEGENLAVLLLAVVLEAVGITLRKDALEQMILASPDIGTTLDEILKSLALRDRDGVLKALDKLVEMILNGSLLATFVQVFGDAAGRALLRSIIGRAAAFMLPFIGWTYFVLCLGISIWNNWDRLVEAT